ncbi:MAG TPA: ion channel [Sphingomicrobium sp.]|nr:ion channel [Sphingomicrobium sp.]
MDSGPSRPLRYRKKSEIRLGYQDGRSKTPFRLEFIDPYYWLMEIRWPAFMAATILCFLLINLLFAFIYLAMPGSVANAQPGSLSDAFFFSVDTLATVGYGNMFPASRLGHGVAAVEIFIGLFYLATVTGLVFARFSRPRHGLLFSRNAVIGRYKGKPALMVRVAWTRSFPLLDAVAQLSWLEQVSHPDGKNLRRLRELELERSHNPIVGLGWTLIHVLPGDSDILEALERDEPLLLTASVSGTDMLLASPSQSLQRYRRDEILVDHEFVEMISEDEDGICLDLRNLHLTHPIALDASLAAE